AEILAAKAALRSGIGIAKAVVADKNYSAFCSCVPEAVTHPVPTDKDGSFSLSSQELEELYSSADAVLIGPGMGQSFTARQTIINAIKSAEIPVVLDADGINALSFDINILRRIKAPVIITPHPGEMARLCGKTVKEVESNRISTAVNFAMDTGCITVLKGANTIVAAPDGRVFFNTTGNPGLATGGSGDVLSGILVSLLAQGYSPLTAALSGVFIHGKAGDIAAEKYDYASMLPTDVITELKMLLD
ncbi:MAG: NAD(P)H-hydrate dehydratase, partial [Clostridia bacterium]|nr:NAD(P)H-hydrate dehydratase [Clostridia bacterium]